MGLYEVTQDDEANRERKKIAKAVRSAVRLHYSMMADDYINQVLPAILDEHKLALDSDEDFTLRLADLPALPLPEDVA